MIVAGRKATLLVVALIVSVCLNVFAAAGWGTHVLGEKPRGRGGFGIGRLVHTAPDEAKAIVRAQFAEVRPRIKAGFAAYREAREGVARVMHDPAASPEELEAAFAEMRRRGDEVQLLVHGTLLEALDAMPEDVRARWAKEWRDRQ